MRLVQLNKTILSLQNNPQAFLNGLTSNAVDQPRNAFLNIHGRIIATFDQIIINENEMQLVIENDYVQAVSAHLDRYLKLAGVQLDSLKDVVYFDLEGDCFLEEGDRVILQKKGRLLLTTKLRNADVSAEEFTLFRLQYNIPMLGVDYKDEMLLNVATDEFVSFTKGCYLGQEPISKVYNRSKPTWKLVVKYEDECNEEEKQKMTSIVEGPVKQKRKGFVFVRNI